MHLLVDKRSYVWIRFGLAKRKWKIIVRALAKIDFS